MKRVLFITHEFPPKRSQDSVQAALTARALAEAGWRSCVLTVAPKCYEGAVDPDLDALTPHVRVVRTRTVEGGRLFRYLSAAGLKTLAALPDRQVLWRLFARGPLERLLARTRFDLIHSWAMPCTSHLIALRAKRSLGLPWVARFSDPWVDGPYFTRYSAWQERLNRRWEADIVREADALVFVCDDARRLVLAKYGPAAEAKAFVVPHGLDPEAMDRVPGRSCPGDRLNILYSGSFYGPRTPYPLLQALERLPDRSEFLRHARIDLVGPMPHREYRSAVDARGLHPAVRFLEPVTYLESWAAMKGADVLLVIDAPLSPPQPSPFLPTKLVEYLGTGKPILAITPPQGASADLVRAAGGIVVDPEDVNGIAQALGRLLTLWRAGRLGELSPDPRVAALYHIRRTTSLLLEAFDFARQPGAT